MALSTEGSQSGKSGKENLKYMSSEDLEAFRQRVQQNVKKHFSHDREGGGGAAAVHGRRKRKRKPRNNKFKGWPSKARLSSLSEEGSVTGTDESTTRKVGGNGDRGPMFGRPDGSSETGNDNLKKQKQGKKRKNKGASEAGSSKTKTKKPNDQQGGRAGMQKPSTEVGKDSAPSSNSVEAVAGSDLETGPTGEMQTVYAVAKKKKKRELPPGNPRDHWGNQLRGARFRFINEALYKTSGEEAFAKFGRDRSAFEAYFEGYNQQVEGWPENPVDVIIQYLNSSPQTWVVGDFGCGEAKIAESVKQKVHSFDMFPTNKRVTVCNISKVPLKSESLDVAVYCLSLMGTNWTEYLQEAHRVLRKGGHLRIAEVASRFKSVGLFLNVLNKLGFTLKNKNLTNKMFYLFDFVKTKKCNYVKGSLTNILKPCEYKRR